MKKNVKKIVKKVVKKMVCEENFFTRFFMTFTKLGKIGGNAEFHVFRKSTWKRPICHNYKNFFRMCRKSVEKFYAFFYTQNRWGRTISGDM